MRLDASGNLGLGVTPSAWSGGNVALDMGGDPFSGINASLRLGLTTNAYAIGATYYYRASGLSSQQYRLSVGTNNHEWYVAPSGTAGAAISYTQAMTLGANGNLLVGTTTDNGARLQVSGSGTFSGNVNVLNSASDADLKVETTLANAGARLRLKTSTTEWYIYTNQTSSTLRFFNGDDRFVLTNTGAATFSGNVSAGGLHVANGVIVAAGSSTTGFYTLPTSSNNTVWLITLRQQGAANNTIMGMAFAINNSATATRLAFNSSLSMDFSVSGLTIQLVLGAGFGTTTWEYTITQIK
jgi:hypothetical protein